MLRVRTNARLTRAPEPHVQHTDPDGMAQCGRKTTMRPGLRPDVMPAMIPEVERNPSPVCALGGYRIRAARRAAI